MFLDDMEPEGEDIDKQTAPHTHTCENCGTPFPCVMEECEEPFMCAECLITEGEDGNDD